MPNYGQNAFWWANPSGLGGATGPMPMGSYNFGEWQGRQDEFLRHNPPLYPGFGPTTFAAPKAYNSSAWASPVSPVGPVGPVAPSGLPLLQTVKWPEGDAALNAALTQVTGNSGSPNQPLFTSVRDPAQQAAIDAARGAVTESQNAQRNTLKDYTTAELASRPQNEADYNLVQGNIRNIQGSGPGSLAGRSAAIDTEAHSAGIRGLNETLGNISARMNLGLMRGGNDSYLQSEALRAGALGSLAQSAQDAANKRDSLRYVTGQQVGTAGLPLNLAQTYLNMRLAPILANQTVTGNTLGNLGALGTLQNQNALYQTPEQLQQARIANILALISGKNNANIFGLGGNFPGPSFPNIPRGFGPEPSGPSYGPGPSGFGNTLRNIDATTGQPNYGPIAYDPQNPGGGIDPAWLYGDFTGFNSTPSYPNRGTGTGGFGDMPYIPGIGYVPTSGYDNVPVDAGGWG